MGATAVALIGLSMSGVRAESLKSALTAAYAHNPTITSSLFAVKVASENIALRKSATLPVVGAGLSLSNTAITTGSGITNSQSAQAGLTYSQTLFDNHKTDADVEQARALVQVANQSLRGTEESVLLDVVEAYMNVILNTELVTLRTDTEQFYQSQVKAAQDRQNIGEGTKIDVAQAQASYANAVAARESAVAGLQTAQASYTHWVGHKPMNLSSDYNYGTLIPATVDRAVSLSGTLNPSILAARASIRAAQAGVDSALASFGPTAGLSGQVGPSFSGPSGSGSGSAGLALAGQLSLSLSMPVYAGGALGAAARQANLSTVKSTLDAQAAIDQVTEQVVTAWSNLQNAAAQIESANTAVQAGQLALQGVIQERDVGQKTTLDVLNEEATVETSQEALITANASRVVAAFTLIGAIGKMSPGDLGLHVAAKSAQPYIEKVEDTWEEIPSFEPMPRPAWRH
jgi:outer membrane protein